MSVAAHHERRGAVYYWRQRWPAALAGRLGQRRLVLSLKTKDYRQACYLGAQLDAAAVAMFLKV